MIYDHSGASIQQVLMQAAIAKAERARRRKLVQYEVDVEGTRLYHILHTKLGDAYRVFRVVMRDSAYGGERLRAIRAKRRAREDARRACASHS